MIAEKAFATAQATYAVACNYAAGTTDKAHVSAAYNAAYNAQNAACEAHVTVLDIAEVADVASYATESTTDQKPTHTYQESPATPGIWF